MLTPSLQDLSKHDLKQVPQGGYRNLNSAISKRAEYSVEQYSNNLKEIFMEFPRLRVYYGKKAEILSPTS